MEIFQSLFCCSWWRPAINNNNAGYYGKISWNAKTIKTGILARGFQEEQDLVVEFPTAHNSALRIAFAITAMKSWKIKTTDIKSAFLQDQNVERDLFLVPPNGSGGKISCGN